MLWRFYLHNSCDVIVLTRHFPVTLSIRLYIHLRKFGFWLSQNKQDILTLKHGSQGVFLQIFFLRKLSVKRLQLQWCKIKFKNNSLTLVFLIIIFSQLFRLFPCKFWEELFLRTSLIESMNECNFYFFL